MDPRRWELALRKEVNLSGRSGQYSAEVAEDGQEAIGRGAGKI